MTDFLFARPSFFEGIGRIIDLGGTLTEFNTSLGPEQADRLATASDYMAVASDLRASAERVMARERTGQLELFGV